jgi:hypothetical protein
MDGLDLAGFRREPERFGRDGQELRRIAEIEPRLDPVFGRFVHGNAVMGAQRGDALAGPSIALAGNKAIPVQDCGDEIVIGDQHELANGGDHVS